MSPTLIFLLALTTWPHTGAPAALHESTIQAVRDAAERPGRPFDQPDRAERYYAEQRLPAGRDVDPMRLYAAALDHMERLPRYSSRLGRELTDRGRLAVKAELAAWEHLGPGNIGGRTRAILIHPDKPRIRWAAGVSGGVWKTEDGGASWRPQADLMPNIAVNSMAMDPGDPDVIYAGTGEGFFREEVRETSLPLRGAGIFKTTDGGATWTRLPETFSDDFRWVNAIAVSHGNPRRLYAATRTGVWRSLNAGNTWRRVHATEVKGGCLDLAIRSDRPGDVVFASCGTFEQATVYRNPRAHAGGGWLPVLTEAGMGRTSLALAPSNQDVIYALSASYLPGPGGRFMGGLHAVFRSDRAGTSGSWEAVTRNTDPDKIDTLLLTNAPVANLVACGFGTQDGYSTLGWYTNEIAVDPTDPDVVFAGGVDLFRSDDGGRSWGVITYWYASPPSAHADQHAVVFHPRYDGAGNQVMLVGGDGGVWLTPNARAAKATGAQATCNPANSAVRWFPLNHNYGVTQFYHGAAFPDGQRYFGGTQDNGTVLGRDAAGVDGWEHVLGGDGGYVAVDPRNPNVVYASSQGKSLAKSVDGGATFRGATNGITDVDFGAGVDDNGDFLFIVPYVLDPSAPDRLWYGGRRLWTTTDGAATWRPASTPWPSGGRMSAVAVSPVDSNRVVVGLNDGTIHYQDQAGAAGADTQWPSARPRAGFVSWLAFDPVDPLRVYATYATFGGKHVWTSADGGATWRQLDGNGPRRLPNLPVHSIVADPGDPQRLFVGTDLGVFTSTTGGIRWAVENTGFANALTETLQIQSAGGATWLFAFTHGRGAWRVELSP
ncbi:MAG TPA: hypothetical protein VGG06_09375 [Thermoanaerobaculia bacterium]|jgi:photosystem II stability/assembly factor-like uncharacterized protein